MLHKHLNPWLCCLHASGRRVRCRSRQLLCFEWVQKHGPPCQPGTTSRPAHRHSSLSDSLCGAPAGAAPLFFSERALKKLRERKTKPMSYNWVRRLPSSIHALFTTIMACCASTKVAC